VEEPAEPIGQPDQQQQAPEEPALVPKEKDPVNASSDQLNTEFQNQEYQKQAQHGSHPVKGKGTGPLQVQKGMHGMGHAAGGTGKSG